MVIILILMAAGFVLYFIAPQGNNRLLAGFVGMFVGLFFGLTVLVVGPKFIPQEFEVKKYDVAIISENAFWYTFGVYDKDNKIEYHWLPKIHKIEKHYATDIETVKILVVYGKLKPKEGDVIGYQLLLDLLPPVTEDYAIYFPGPD